tara:strand:+ start:1833 stop:2258 length:426 start_codon:yes stop_codon:yes gene_type:complete
MVKMEAFGNEVTNFTFTVVKNIEQRFKQSEKTATVEVGVAVGAVASIMIMLCIFCSARACRCRRGAGTVGPMCCKPPVSKVTIDVPHSEDEDAAADGGCKRASQSAGTEGAYRSESDSDDEGESVRVAREAQKRARAMGEM